MVTFMILCTYACAVSLTQTYIQATPKIDYERREFGDREKFDQNKVIRGYRYLQSLENSILNKCNYRK